MPNNQELQLSMVEINKLFDTIQYIEIETFFSKSDEKSTQESDKTFLNLQNIQNKKAYQQTLKSDKAIYLFEQNEESIIIHVILPTVRNSRKILLDCSVNITKRTDISHYHTIYENMYKLSVTDELTGAFNRRFINQSLPIIIADCSENNKPLSVIFIDLDSFKNINDLHGHSAGDYILNSISSELQKHIRQNSDWVARYGGDEFLVCLPNLDNNNVKKRAENIRRSIEAKIFQYQGIEIKMTCSFGVFTLKDFNPPPSMNYLLEEVDKRLYHAKKEGKNRIY